MWQQFISILEKAFNWIVSTFDTHTKGASARKITAFWVIVILATASRAVWLTWAWKHNDFALLPQITDADYLFAAVLLGLVTYQAIKDKKTNNPEKDAE